jgi:exosortase/archaeosortase family protein
MKKSTMSEQKTNKSLINLIVRYLLILLVGLGVVFTNIFYKIFLYLTIYPLGILLKILYSVEIFDNLLIFNSLIVELIPACIAVSAYFLLLILVFSCPIGFKRQIKALFVGFIILLAVNILRMFILIILAIQGSNLFNVLHTFFWYFLSTVFVVIIWFIVIYIFKIKEIPVYTDIRYLIKSIRK